MTTSELRAKFEEAYKIIKNERRMRQHVFRSDPVKMKAKVQEMDRLLQLVTELKDALKPHCEPEYEQESLLDVPKRVEY